ncbi:MAG: hypothetical protein J0H10_15840 [Alphaproteobacteria bacterium]|nr:hypothetical protein [Alphaproteobacteria bacterium]
MTDIIRRAAQAAVELTETEAAFDKMHENAIRLWVGTGSSETEKREDIWRTIKTIDAVRKELRTIINAGKIEQASRDGKLA